MLTWLKRQDRILVKICLVKMIQEVHPMIKNKILIKSSICFLLILVCLPSRTMGEESSYIVYKVYFNNNQKPQMSLPEAYQNIKKEFLTSTLAVYGMSADIKVTNDGISFMFNGTNSGKFDEIQSLSVYTNDYVSYNVNWKNNIWGLTWKSQRDAQNFVDAIMAMKYYASKQFLADDASSFVDFEEKANVWRALTQKPRLPEETRRFRVLADDAVQNKQFDKAADYYEQGLAIEPMWAAGQFNAALIYAELEFYPLAVMHMKRYLALEPNAKDVKVYQDKIYIWEEKANE
jgi:tetratricopeptide (TPR) repeat protein